MALDVASSKLIGSPSEMAAQPSATSGQNPTSTGQFAAFLGQLTGQPAPRGHAKSGTGTASLDSGTESHARPQTDEASVDGLVMAASALALPIASQQAALLQPKLNFDTTAAGQPQKSDASKAVDGLAMDTGRDASTQASTAGELLPTNTISDDDDDDNAPLPAMTGPGTSPNAASGAGKFTLPAGFQPENGEVAASALSSTSADDSMRTVASASTAIASPTVESSTSLASSGNSAAPAQATAPQAALSSALTALQSGQIPAGNLAVAAPNPTPQATLGTGKNAGEKSTQNALKSKTANADNGSTGQTSEKSGGAVVNSNSRTSNSGSQTGGGESGQSQASTGGDTGTETPSGKASANPAAAQSYKAVHAALDPSSTSTATHVRKDDIASSTPVAQSVTAASSNAATAPNAPSNATTLSPADRAEVVKQIASQVGSAPLTPGQNKVTVQLHPQDWGSVNVHVTVAPSTQAGGAPQVTAHLVAESPAVKQALDSQMTDLRKALETAGLRLQNAVVSVQATSAGAQSGSAGSGTDPGTRHNLNHWGADGSQTTGGSSQGQGGFASFAGNGQSGGRSQTYYAASSEAAESPVEAAATPSLSGRLDTRA